MRAAILALAIIAVMDGSAVAEPSGAEPEREASQQADIRERMDAAERAECVGNDGCERELAEHLARSFRLAELSIACVRADEEERRVIEDAIERKLASGHRSSFEECEVPDEG